MANDTFSHSDSPTVSLYHPSDFLRSAADLSGCCCQDLERTAGQSRFNDVTTDFPVPFEDISVSAFFFLALQWMPEYNRSTDRKQLH